MKAIRAFCAVVLALNLIGVVIGVLLSAMGEGGSGATMVTCVFWLVVSGVGYAAANESVKRREVQEVRSASVKKQKTY